YDEIELMKDEIELIAKRLKLIELRVKVGQEKRIDFVEDVIIYNEKRLEYVSSIISYIQLCADLEFFLGIEIDSLKLVEIRS
ncbi:hypothetical protein ACFL6D_04955, partial [Spirochaetota bacterium]